MKVFVIGASGLVGSHCLKYFKQQGVKVLGTHRNYPTSNTIYFDPQLANCFDILDKKDFNPDVIIHCGALTNVDYCEENIEESYQLTVRSAEVITEYCKIKQIKLVYISTDYVFDGLDGPYSENAKPNPINVYGKHKLEAEGYVSALEKHLITRITNVYGEEDRSKNFIAALVKAIDTDTEKVFNLPVDQFATPIYASDIAKMLYLLIQDGKKGIYNLSSTDYYNRYQLAKKVVSLFDNNIKLEINPISTFSSAQKAKRPLNGGVINNKFSREYPHYEFTNVDKFILDTYKNGI